MQEPTPAASRAPHDLGLTGLGLIMQYGASMMLLFTFGVLGSLAMSLLAMDSALNSTFGSFLMVVVALIVGLTRGGLGLAAGVKLTSGGYRAAKSVRVYCVFAVVQTVVLLALFRESPVGSLLLAALGLLAWPGLLFAMFQRRPIGELLRRVDEGEDTLIGADRGIEGVSLVLVVLGALGTISVVLTAYAFAADGILGLLRDDGLTGALAAALLLGLLARSVMHLLAGLRNVRPSSAEAFARSISHYYRAAMVSAAIYVLVMVRMVMASKHGLGFVLLGTFLGLLVVWPLILRAFARRVSAISDDDDTVPAFGPAPDGGASTIGWLLLAVGAFGCAASTGHAFDTSSGGLVFLIGLDLWRPGLPMFVPVLNTALTLWAGYELATSSRRVKVAGLIYAGVGLASAAYNLAETWPIFAAFRFEVGNLLILGEVLGGVILPLVVAWSVLRKPYSYSGQA